MNSPAQCLKPAFILFVLAGALSACSKQAEAPLESNPTTEVSKPVDHSRALLSSLPIQPFEPSGGSICSLEGIEGAPGTEVRADGSMTVSLPARASGWAFPPADLPKPANGWLRLLPHDAAMAPREFALTANIARPDVSEAHGATAGSSSGFGEVIISDLPPGTYDAQIVFVAADSRATCSNARRLIVR